MTQEELDALMSSDDLDNIDTEYSSTVDESADDMAGQLNSITVDSEKKATEIMTMLDQVLSELDAIQTCTEENSKEKSLVIINDIRNIIFEIMSTMQYQDIHRQKIERVMNTMIDISQMMAKTLDGVVTKKAPEAKHIDNDDGDTIGDDELDALIAQMGQK